MYAFMDHEDFVKSRKALISTSFILLIIQIFEFSGSQIDIFGLVVKFNKNVSIGLSSLFVIYFLFIFIMRALDGRVNDIYTRIADREKRIIQEDINEIRGNYTSISTPEEHIEWLEKKLNSTEALVLKKADYMRLIIYILADILPPVSLAIFSLSKVNFKETLMALL
ncbi:hypothetical protein ACWF50_09730 [Brucella pseudogrignonensis]